MPQGEDVLQFSFLARDGSSLLALVKSRLLMMTKRDGVGVTSVLADTSRLYSLNLMGQYAMRFVDFVVVHDRALVNVAVRTNKEGEFERTVSTIWVNTRMTGDLLDWPWVVVPSMREMWMGYAASEYPLDDPMSSPANGMATLLLWPTTSTGSVQRMRLRYRGNTSVSVESIEPFQQGQSLMARASLLPRQLVLSRNLRVASGKLTAFASTVGSTYDWLQQLRLLGEDLQL